MKQKAIFQRLFIITAIILTVLPVMVTFSAVLTSLFNHLGWYVLLQKVVVPFEARLVAVMIKVVGISPIITPGQKYSMLLQKPSGGVIPVDLQWNCLGWQSLTLLALTLFTGLKGSYTTISKLETVAFGILGTFLSNLMRMAFIISVSYYWNSFAVMIIHDYFAVFIALVWMIFFWWFSYTYILDKREQLE